MRFLRSAAILALLFAACGGSSKPQTMPAEPMPASPAPAADKATTPIDPATPASAMEPDAAKAADAPDPAVTTPPTPVPRNTRAPVKKPAKNADPCDGGE